MQRKFFYRMAGGGRNPRRRFLAGELLEKRLMLDATTLEVTTFADVMNPNDGVLSLREAVLQANSNQGDFVIKLAAGTYTLSTVGSNENTTLTGDLDITPSGKVAIVGVGPGQTIIDGGYRFDFQTGQTTVAGMGDRIFEVRSGGKLHLQGVTVTGGQAVGSGGGGIFNQGTLTVVGSEISGNWGGIDNQNSGQVIVHDTRFRGNAVSGSGGAISNQGTLTVENADIAGNRATNTGGGLYNSGLSQATIRKTQFTNNAARSGGAIGNSGELALNNSTVSGSTATFWGGGVYNLGGGMTIAQTLISNNASSQRGGGIYSSDRATLNVIDSTLSGNTAGIYGGGIDRAGPTTIYNTTISNNSASNGGGIFSSGGALVIRHSTVFGNSSTNGGGIQHDFGTASLHHTIFAGNTAGGGTPRDVYGSMDSASSFNLIGSTFGVAGLLDGVNGNRLGVPWVSILNPNLANNGGPTPTHALLPAGPAINAGNSNFDPAAFDPPLWFDQRGSGYERVAGGRIDIGAFEFQTGPGEPVEPAADPFEPNDTRLAATNLGAFEGLRNRTGLSIHDGGDEDWFRFTTIGTGTAQEFVGIEFRHALGDLELELYDADGLVLAGSWSNNDDEQISLGDLPPGEYYLRVFGYEGTTHPDYSLFVDAPLAAPSDLVAEPVSFTQVRLNWRDNSQREANFVIERGLGDEGAWQTIATVGANVTSYLDEGVGSDQSYRYRIRATNAEQLSIWSNVASARTESDWSFGEKSVLYIRVDFSDRPGEPVSASNVASTMAQVNEFFLRNSYGQFSIPSYTLTPTLRMPHTAQWYVNTGGDERLRLDALDAALSIGLDHDDYWSHIVAFEHLFEGYAGRAWAGDSGVWLNGAFGRGTTIHELGHNLGPIHSNLWQTSDGSIIGSGTNVEYGNQFDVMGNSSNLGDFNVVWKTRLNWLDPLEHVDTVTASGMVELNAFDLGSVKPDGTYAVVLPKEDGRTYWLEFRQDTSHPQSQYYMDGVLVNWAPRAGSGGGTQLLDMQPGSQGSALRVGTTFSDFDDNIHITPVSIIPGQSIKVVTYLGAKAPGTLAGRLWHDLDRDGAIDSREPALSGWRVFIDANGNGIFDTGEASTMAGTDGSYAFTSMAPGNYKLRVSRPTSDWIFSTNESQSVSLELGWASENLHFGLFERSWIPILLAVQTFADVINPNDGVLSLREAIRQANADRYSVYQIQLAAGTYTLSISGANEDAAATGDLDILNPSGVTIIGAGMDDTILNAGGAAGLNDRVFHLLSGGKLTLEGLEITGGSADRGGGIYNSGSLSMNGVGLSHNSAARFGGALFNVGARSTAILRNSRLLNNNARFGGGIDNHAGSLVATNSVISQNLAVMGGGVFNIGGAASITQGTLWQNAASMYGGGMFNANAAGLTVTDVAISQNSSAFAGGGVFNAGLGTTAVIKDSSLSSNSAEFAGAGNVFNLNPASLQLINTTLSASGDDRGGGEYTGDSGDAGFGPLWQPARMVTPATQPQPRLTQRAAAAGSIHSDPGLLQMWELFWANFSLTNDDERQREREETPEPLAWEE